MYTYALSHYSEVCIQLLNQYFGDAVGKVGAYLLRRGRRPMFELASATGLSMREVKKALAIMIQNNLVKFEANERNPNLAEYTVVTDHVYRLLRYPNVGEEVLLEVLLNQGQASASTIIFQAANRLKEAGEDSKRPSALQEHFLTLAKNQFIIRCPALKTSSTAVRVPQFSTEENRNELFKVPEIDVRNLEMKFRENAQTLGDHSDSKIIWRVNHERFDVQMRDLILISAAERRIDSTAGELYSILLKQWHEISPENAPSTNMLSYNQIKDSVRRNDSSSPRLLEFFEEYIRVLSEDSSDLVSKAGDAGGGQFVLNYASVFENLAAATLDSIVLEKFGSKALRIFRLIRMQKYMEQDPCQTASMISAKEAKYFTYRLMEHNFLQIRELRKGVVNTQSSKLFVLYYVDLQQVARTALELSYKGLFNAMLRRDHDITSNERLLVKQERVESLLANLRNENAPEEDIAYVADSITASEKSLLARIQAMSDNVIRGTSQVDETILILESYLKLAVAK